MAIEQIEISHFRNLLKVSLTPSPQLNIIIGKNGSGKTSLLEAISFLGTARSFRTPHSKHLISFGCDQFVLHAKIATADIPVSVGIAKDKQAMTIKVANQSVSSASVLAGILPVQVINPDVHKLLEEGPRCRRKFIEWGVFHVKQGYLGLWQECRHILKQRNAALKQNLSTREIKYWDSALVEISERVTSMRQHYLDNLKPYVDRMIKKVPGLPELSIRLDKGWPTSKSLGEILQESIASDKLKGFTQYGPHRVDLKMKIANLDAKHVVSRGQQKMVTTLLKLAQIQYLEAERQGVLPVVLIDDLPAELDEDYREILMNEIGSLYSQVFITATDLELLKPPSDHRSRQLFHVKHGVIHSIDFPSNITFVS